MSKFKQLATNHPVLFGVIITISVWVFYVAAGILAQILEQEKVGHDLVEMTGRLLASFLFLCLLWRFNWFDASGVTRSGSLGAWLVTLLLIAYEIIAYQFPFFGDLEFQISNPGVSISVGLNALVTGLIEELPFRGIILYSFLRLWGDTRKGLVRSVLIAALFFSGSHLVHVAFGSPFGMVAMKMVVTFLSSIYFSALVLHWRSIWTVVLFHGVLNAFMSIRAIEVPGFAETAPALGTISLLQVPLVVFGAYLISKVPLRPVVPDAS
jgi:membrane protease YdiL (CAAX protease family)